MPGLFPNLPSIKTSFKYPSTRTNNKPGAVATFCDFSEQRWNKSVAGSLYQFNLNWNRIKTVDKEAIRTFYDTQGGEYHTDWSMYFDNVLYRYCQFIGPFSATEVGPGIWNVSLQARTMSSGNSAMQTTGGGTGGGTPGVTFNVIASFVPGDNYTGMPVIEVVIGSPNIQQADNSTTSFPITTSVATSPTTYSLTLGSSYLNQVPSMSVVSFIEGTVYGADISTPDTLNIYDVTITVVNLSGVSTTYRASSTYSSSGTGGPGVFDTGTSGTVTNEANAIDTDTTTAATIQRQYYNGFLYCGYLQVYGF